MDLSEHLTLNYLNFCGIYLGYEKSIKVKYVVVVVVF